MKILMVVTKLNIGGTEKYILSICRFLRSRGISVGIAAQRGPLASACKEAGIRVHLLSSKPRSMRDQVSILSSALAKEKYRIVHAHDSKSFQYVTALSQKRVIRLFATVHGAYRNHSALMAMSRSAHKMVAVSPWLSRWLSRHKKIPTQKLAMIPNGIDTSVFRSASNQRHWRKRLNLPENAKILVYAGRFEPDKYGIARKVILASERIAKHERTFIAVLVGPGFARVKLNKLAEDVNRRLNRKAIHVRPAHSNIQKVYQAADFVVGTGRVALEAMACSKPVIAVGVAGYCGVVKPNNLSSILYCHFGDHGALSSTTTERLASDIQYLIKHPKQAKSLGRFGADTIKKRYSVNRVGSRLIRLYTGN